jgi:hypothetical protein
MQLAWEEVDLVAVDSALAGVRSRWTKPDGQMPRTTDTTLSRSQALWDGLTWAKEISRGGYARLH